MIEIDGRGQFRHRGGEAGEPAPGSGGERHRERYRNAERRQGQHDASVRDRQLGSRWCASDADHRDRLLIADRMVEHRH